MMRRMGAVRVLAHGTVQGVGFREGTRRRAEQLGARGWVRNREDGTVEALIEGDDEAAEALVAWIRDGGPRGAAVERVETSPAAAEGSTGFTVR